MALGFRPLGSAPLGSGGPVSAGASPQTISVIHASEADAAQAIAVSTTFLAAIGAASETDSAQSITPVTAVATSLLPATESDSVQAITPVPGGVIITVNAASETGQSQPITLVTSGSFTQAQLDEILAYVEANMAVPTVEQIAAAVWAEILSGTAAGERLAAVASDVLAAASVTPIQADIRKVNSLAVDGAGTEADPWGPV